MSRQDEFDRAIADGVEFELSTGRMISMRLIELTRFVENGEVPDSLTPLVHQELYGDDNDTVSLQERNQRYMNTLKVARWVADNVLKEPIDNLFNSELLEIYGLANNPAKALTRFRLQQARSLEVGAAMREVGPKTESTA